MDIETQALIDQLRDRMADMPPVTIYSMMESLCDGYLDVSFDHNNHGFVMTIRDRHD